MAIKAQNTAVPANPEDKSTTWLLRLYVAGHTTKSIAAFNNLKRICETHLKGLYQIEVVDLLVIHSLPKGIRSSPFRLSYDSCRHP